MAASSSASDPSAGPPEGRGRGWLARWLPAPGAAPRRLNLALQGGGAHGAFTWGVLDALLQEPDLTFEGLSGSSAGAVNAVVLAHGWLQGGREGARAALQRFWTALGEQMPWALLARRRSDVFGFDPAAPLLAGWARQLSPAQLNPLDLNPLRDLLQQQIDFDALRRDSPFKLFIGTTQVRTGKLRVFREHELSVDVLLASACLPRIHRTVVLDGEPYWDGGYAANPAVFPLFYECEALDVLLVLLNPLVRETWPQTMAEIDVRIAELGFSANFLREMRMYAMATAYAAAGSARGRLEQRLLALRFHMIDPSGVPALQRSDTKLLPHPTLLQQLHAQGREQAQHWLRTAAAGVGQRSTIDVQALFG
ncbi:MAG: patatin-like phospholipase family protein [Hylemonella sp.]